MPRQPLNFITNSDARVIRAKAEAILWVKSAIARHGVTLFQLQQAGCVSDKSETVFAKYAKYIDAEGHSWDGVGDMPEWLQRAINAGQSMDHFRVT